MKIGDKIAMARKTQNLTQEQLADLIGVTRQAVSRWESGLAYPEMDKFVKLAEILQVNCDYLLKDNVLETGEQMVTVEVADKEVSIFKKLNWKFITAICEILFGLYVLAFNSIFVYFNRSYFVSRKILPIIITVIGFLIGIVTIITGSIIIIKNIKAKEYFIKSEYIKS